MWSALSPRLCRDVCVCVSQCTDLRNASTRLVGFVGFEFIMKFIANSYDEYVVFSFYRTVPISLTYSQRVYDFKINGVFSKLDKMWEHITATAVSQVHAIRHTEALCIRIYSEASATVYKRLRNNSNCFLWQTFARTYVVHHFVHLIITRWIYI